MSDELTLATMDREGAIEESLDGLTRGQALKGALGAAIGAGTGAALLGATAPEAFARSRTTDLKILQFALVLEGIGVNFYGEVVKLGLIRGETRRFAETVHQHELVHAAFIKQTIRSMGATPKNPPRFDFGTITHDARRFRSASAKLEELCVEALNGAGPLVTKPLLAGAAQLVSVEARHVSWVRQISGSDPVPSAFDAALTPTQSKAAAKATGFIKSSF